MTQDNKVLAYVSPEEMAALMSETGMIAVHERVIVDGKPVIHAALKVVNAQTGEQLPGGLPFSVVMFKSQHEPGYSNIAIGTVVPVAELEITLPRDYFNFCNQRFRFTRVFPLDERSFVLQMDLFVRNATREYVKFSFGIWAAMFSQVLFELMGRGKESLVAAAEAYAAAKTGLSQQYVSTMTASDEPAPVDPALDSVPTPIFEPATVVDDVAPLPVSDADLAGLKEPASEEAIASEPAAQEKAAPEITVQAEADNPAAEPPAMPAASEPRLEPSTFTFVESSEGRETTAA